MTRRWKRSDISRRAVLELFDRPFDQRYPAGLVLAAETGAPFKVAWAAMERELANDFLDFGTWLHGAWLTEKGQAELQRLREAEQEPRP